MSSMEKLHSIRARAGEPVTKGLPDTVIEQFLATDKTLETAIAMAEKEFACLESKYADILNLPEMEQVARIQAEYVNFYTDDTINPYVSLAAKGPWIVTTCGAVIHDNGGYGMLGMGHSPDDILIAMNQPHVMANIMTANFSQLRLVEKLRGEIGYRRDDRPFEKFLCLNSGSEAVTVATRISDINAAKMTADGGPHAGKKVKFLALKGGFHGRTERPAQASDSSLTKYRATLKSFMNLNNLVTVEANNENQLKQAFAQADAEGVYFECVMMEPVMGEGNPGVGITPSFYQLARELTMARQSLLLVDSIQAGLRAHGCLSIVDYPGFEKLAPPDMETYSKALNAGQYPLSVLALRSSAANLYIKGVYGNTMTTNPRAAEVACAVLDRVTPEFRKNVQDRGVEFVDKLRKLQKEFPDTITNVTGTGLLFAAHLNPAKYKVVGFGALEETMRRRGIGVIHGGENALRFTPHFHITSAEIDLVIGVLRDILAGN